MSAERWNIAGIPEMLELAAGRISSRKLNLFNIWCCQMLRPYLTDRRSIAAARFADRHVDASAEDLAERDLILEDARQAVLDLTNWAKSAATAAEYRKRRVYANAAHVAEQAVSNSVRNSGVLANSKHTAHVFSWANDDGRDPLAGPDDEDGLRGVHFRKQEYAFREIVGNPFQSIVFDPRWQTSDVLGIARAIYEDKAFVRMPILSDALMDAGCEEETILSHCRSKNRHILGCWLIDRILGKE